MTVSDTEPEATAGTSGGTPGPPPVAPGRPTGIGPAAIAAVIGVVVVVIFVVLALVTGGGSGRPVHTPTGPVSGTSLRAVAGAGALGPLVSGGEPPANIVSAVTVPERTTRTSVTNAGSGLGQYDRTATMKVAANQDAVYDFFHVQMRRAGWSVSDAGPAPGGRNLEVLGKLGGNDGWYWEMGATISPTTFADTAAGPGTGAATTRFTIRLYQVSDES